MYTFFSAPSFVLVLLWCSVCMFYVWFFIINNKHVFSLFLFRSMYKIYMYGLFIFSYLSFYY